MAQESHDSLWEQYNIAASNARHQGNHHKAYRIYREALRESEDYGEVSPSLVSQVEQFAEYYSQIGRYQEAESLYRAVLETREKLLGPSHPDVCDSLKKVAVVQILGFRAEALGPKRRWPWLGADGDMAIAN